jgi:polyisoprenoid-binding protein YceI
MGMQRSFKSLSLALAFLASARVQAGALALSSTTTASLKILGDSTLHHWQAKAASLEIRGELKEANGDLLSQVEGGALLSLSLSADVEALKSAESASMDRNIYKAMESQKFPKITFFLRTYQIENGEATAKGPLSIHGVTKDVELKGKLLTHDGLLNVKGSYPLLMSDYGVKAPVMMLGALRVVDKVLIDYDFDLLPLGGKR